ncbi:transporter substrate-binding domain-containing protein [Pannonibacter sp. SL95]|jgi:urea transport system substrate-binding protein|uniref:transporter substrate-binding domain-containing protein n=1 Tax=Pannonibacter sp. SL95 TaxID=2995153 RepID=UPI002274751B|nr:transporter substrate-binding domain-containing protein [Pannonibacter sp. SL95]MCY1704939.1 transporter substrate-binding domain-containing protein [Pannonibacter sp. SL95]
MTMKRRSFLKGIAATGAFAATGFPHIWNKNMSLARAANGEIKVGVLFSLTGTTGIIEESLNKATLLAIEEINAAGGINGMKIVPIVEDPASDPATFAEKARKLVVGDKCVSVFGSYTSASRKAVLPVFEKRDNLYWYPTLYEGRECSKNVIYTGAVPNQQQDEFIPWLVQKFGKKFYLIGSNYIYPKEENNYCKKLLEKLGGEVVNEEYVPLGHSEFSSVINKIQSTQPNVIFSTVVGDSVVALHRQYRAAGLDPEKMPMASLTTSENEVAAMGGEAAAGHFTSAPYFMVHQSPENEKFVAAYKRRWGDDKVTHFVSEPSYFQVYLFKQAVEKLAGSEIDPPTIREAVKGQELIAPQGRIRIEPENLHTFLWPKIAMAKSNGQFEVLESFPEWIAPNPYAAYPGQACTADGLKES